MDKIIELTNEMFIGTHYTSTSDVIGLYELDSIYCSPTFGEAELCIDCGAPIIGVINRVCANPGCAWVPPRKRSCDTCNNVKEIGIDACSGCAG